LLAASTFTVTTKEVTKGIIKEGAIANPIVLLVRNRTLRIFWRRVKEGEGGQKSINVVGSTLSRDTDVCPNLSFSVV
jgi:hypothetical protein